MHRTTTAAILSALVLPGAGQFYLKRYWRGGVFAAVSLASAWVIMADILRRASVVLAQIELGAGAPDVAQIARLAAYGAGEGRITLAMVLLALCWLASVADACWASRPASVPRA